MHYFLTPHWGVTNSVAMIESKIMAGSKSKILSLSKFSVWWFNAECIHLLRPHNLCISFSRSWQALGRKPEGLQPIHDEEPAADPAGCEQVGHPTLCSHDNVHFPDTIFWVSRPCETDWICSHQKKCSCPLISVHAMALLGPLGIAGGDLESEKGQQEVFKRLI